MPKNLPLVSPGIYWIQITYAVLLVVLAMEVKKKPSANLCLGHLEKEGSLFLFCLGFEIDGQL